MKYQYDVSPCSLDVKSANRRLMQYVASFSATLGSLAVGSVLGWSSPAGPQVTEGALGFPVTETEFSWVGACTTLGAAAMVIPGGFLLDRAGRKLAMLLLVPPFAIGWALIIWANSVELLYVGRLLTGVCCGTLSVGGPVYTTEVAEKSLRGALGSFYQLMLTVGILISYILGAVLPLFWFSLISGILPLIFGAVFIFMPETPVHYLKIGKREAAQKTLQWLRGGTDSEIQAELREMESNLLTTQAQFSLSSLKPPAARKGLIVACGLMVFQQLGGVNVVIFYTTIIFKEAGISMSPHLATIIVGVVQCLATLASTLVVEHLGRRILLLISDAVMALCTLLLGVFFYLTKEGTDAAAINWLPLTSLCIFIVVFSLGYGPIPYMIIGEVFLPDLKSVAASMSLLLNWLLAFVVTKFFADLVIAFGEHVTFWIFTVISILGTVFVYFMVPETKGKTIDEIQKLLLIKRNKC